MARKKKKESPLGGLSNRFLILAGILLVLLVAMLVLGTGGLETTMVKPAKLSKLEVVGSRHNKKTIASNEKVLFSWQVEQKGNFNHLKLERLDSSKKALELDLGRFKNKWQVSQVDLDIMPNWKEKVNRFRLTVCGNPSCSKSSSKEVSFTLSDYNPDRKDPDQPIPDGNWATVEAFSAVGQKSGSNEVLATEKMLFSWQLSANGSFDHLELYRISRANNQKGKINLGRFSNNRAAKNIDLSVRPLKGSENIFQLVICPDKECSWSTKKEVVVKLTDGTAASGGGITKKPEKFIISYGWPTEKSGNPLSWDMSTPNTITIRDTQSTPEERKYWREKGKKILHHINLSKYYEKKEVKEELNKEAFISALSEAASEAEFDGINIDEFLLLNERHRDLTSLQSAFNEFNTSHPNTLLTCWIGDAKSDTGHSELVQLLSNQCDYILPEIYLHHGVDSIGEFKAFINRYKNNIPNIESKIIMGINISQYYSSYYSTESGLSNTADWLNFLREQIDAINKLEVAVQGIALYTPQYMPDDAARNEIDGYLKTYIDNSAR